MNERMLQGNTSEKSIEREEGKYQDEPMVKDDERKNGEVLARAKFVEEMEEVIEDVQGRRKQERGLLEAEVTTLGMEKSTQEQEREKIREVERRLLGKNFSPCLERYNFAAFAKQAGEVNRRAGDEAATKNDYSLKI